MNFFTADLCDKYGNETQVLESGFHSYGGVTRFSEQVVTCKIIDNNKELIKLLKSEGIGRVCVVDVGAKYVAVVGDKLMGFAKENGWSGIVVNGYVRDIETTKDIEVGLIALGTCPKKAPKENIGECGIDLHFSGITFKENDYLYADIDGVITSKKSL